MKRILFSILICLIPFIANAVDNKQLLVVTEDLWPYNYVDSHEVKGTNTRLIKHLLDSMNLDYKIDVYPWARSYKTAQNRANVLIYTINRTANRESLFHWIGAFPLEKQVSFYALKSSVIKSSHYDDLKNLHVGIQIHTTEENFLLQQGFKNISRVSHLSQTIGMLLLGRIDLILVSQPQMEKALVEYGYLLEKITLVRHAYRPNPSFALSLQTAPEVVEKFRTAFAQLKRQRDICQIMQLTAPDCKA